MGWFAALQAVGQQLLEPDAASCRLASRQLGTVTAQQQPGSHLQVVASSFQAQLRAEKQQNITPAASGSPGCSSSAVAIEGQAAAAKSRAEAAAAAAAAIATPTASNAAQGAQHQDGDNIEDATANVQQQQQQQQSSVLQPRLSRTASSLVRAAALLGYSRVALHVDVLQMYDEDTWQQLFR
jgi:hypothetical protein